MTVDGYFLFLSGFEIAKSISLPSWEPTVALIKTFTEIFIMLQGELNGQKGLVPSNFLEEVPDDVEVFLSDAPSRYVHDTPMRTKAKRVSNRIRKS